jgi:hypothetical protein
MIMKVGYKKGSNLEIPTNLLFGILSGALRRVPDSYCYNCYNKTSIYVYMRLRLITIVLVDVTVALKFKIHRNT